MCNCSAKSKSGPRGFLDSLTLSTNLTMCRSSLLSAGDLSLPTIQPGEEGRVSLPEDEVLSFRRHDNCWLLVTFRLKEHTAWAKAGHTIAWCQTQMSKTPTNTSLQSRTAHLAGPSSSPTTVQSQLRLETSRLAYTVSTLSTTITVDRIRGQISRFLHNNHPLLVDTRLESHNPASPSPLFALDFWRPPTDNDIAWQTGEWKRYGLHLMISRLKSITASVGSNSNSNESTSAGATSTKAETITIRAEHALAPPSLAWHFNAITTYTFSTSSSPSPFTPTSSPSKISITIHTHLTPHGAFPPDLPRIGYNIQLSPHYTHVKWFGRGPRETYNDKKFSQPVGIWTKKIEEMAEHYEVPQENGNRSDVRWCCVSASPFIPSGNNLGPGEDLTNTFNPPSDVSTTTVTTEKPHPPPQESELPILRASSINHPMQFSTQLYDPLTIENARHPCDLSEPGKCRKGALWRVDAGVAGVGTGACGPGTEEKDQVHTKEMEWTVVLEVL